MVRWRRSVSRSGDDDGMNASESPSGLSLAHTLTSTIADGLVHTVAHWKVLLLGQGVAFILAVAGKLSSCSIVPVEHHLTST